MNLQRCPGCQGFGHWPARVGCRGQPLPAEKCRGCKGSGHIVILDKKRSWSPALNLKCDKPDEGIIDVYGDFKLQKDQEYICRGAKKRECGNCHGTGWQTAALPDFPPFPCHSCEGYGYSLFLGSMDHVQDTIDAMPVCD